MNITEMPRVEILSYVTGNLSDRISRIPNRTLSLSEDSLERKINPDKLDIALRISFWREIGRVLHGQTKKVSDVAIYAGLCTGVEFDERMLSEERIAWIIKPMPSFKREMEVLINVGQTKLFEIMQAPIYSDAAKKKMNTKNAAIVLQAYKMVSEQYAKLMTKAPDPLPNTGEKPLSSSDLDSKIKMLEAELGTDEGEEPQGQEETAGGTGEAEVS